MSKCTRCHQDIHVNLQTTVISGQIEHSHATDCIRSLCFALAESKQREEALQEIVTAVRAAHKTLRDNDDITITKLTLERDEWKAKHEETLAFYEDERKQLANMRLGRDAARNALEIARKRIVEIWQRVDLGQREGALGIVGIALTEIDATSTAALAERDRAIREECATWLYETRGRETAMLFRREFGLDPKPEEKSSNG